MSTQDVIVQLAADIVQVTGTVNGKVVTWASYGSGEWRAVADRSKDDIYQVELTAVSSFGTASNFSIVLYYGLQLITDRTKADVDRASEITKKVEAGTATDEERAELYGGTLKGSYDFSDLNRVGAAIRFLADRLNGLGYNLSVAAKQDWSRDDKQNEQNLEYYLRDIETIRSAFSVMQQTPETPKDLVSLTYTEANNIEKILLDVDFLVTNMMMSFFYSGEIYSGEVV